MNWMSWTDWFIPKAERRDDEAPTEMAAYRALCAGCLVGLIATVPTNIVGLISREFQWLHLTLVLLAIVGMTIPLFGLYLGFSKRTIGMVTTTILSIMVLAITFGTGYLMMFAPIWFGPIAMGAAIIVGHRFGFVLAGCSTASLVVGLYGLAQGWYQLKMLEFNEMLFNMGADAGSAALVIITFFYILNSAQHDVQRRLNAAHQKIIDQHEKVATYTKLAILGELAGGIAHEINNPLMIISGRAEMINHRTSNVDYLDKEDVGKVQHDAETIYRTAFRISRISKTMLRMARHEPGQFNAKCRVVDCVEDILTLTREKMMAVNIQVQVEAADDFLVRGDPAAIYQLLFNLLNNARDAIISDPSWRMDNEHWIKISAERQPDKKIHILVSDSGPGVPEAYQEQLFDPRFTSKAPGHGTGLGLSLSRRLAESMAGQLEFCPEHSASTFLIVLEEAAPTSTIKVAS